jgi:hypothetical protein
MSVPLLLERHSHRYLAKVLRKIGGQVAARRDEVAVACRHVDDRLGPNVREEQYANDLKGHPLQPEEYSEEGTICRPSELEQPENVDMDSD